MKVKLKLFLKRTLRICMTLDRHIIRLLGGQKHFKPLALNMEHARKEDYLKTVSVSDTNSFRKFEQVSKPPFLARGYLFVRNKLFTLAYRTGKKVVR